MANATSLPVTTQRRFTIGASEILNFAYDAFCSTNMIYADYQGGAQRIDSTPDPMTVEDVQAVREQVSSVVAASPTVALGDRISIGAGKQSDILVLGVDPDYLRVRNLKVLAGRFFDSEDSSGRNKVGVITEKLAQKLYGAIP